MSKKTTIFLVIAAVGALLGLVYSGFSTSDFISHLDRQVHPMNCSLLPGLTEASQVDKSVVGCQVAMMSPYSSFWRDTYWGGLPWSLLAMGLFGFALALSLWGFASRRIHQVGPSLFLLLSGLVASVSSLVFFIVSVSKLNTVCTTCVGTYISSALLLAGGCLVFLSGRSDRKASQEEASPAATWIGIAVLAAEMGIAVFLPLIVYVSALPDYDKYVTECGKLPPYQYASVQACTADGVKQPECERLARVREDMDKALLRVGSGGTTDAILVMDPLCPQCKHLHERLKVSPAGSSLAYRLMFLPLDNECFDWMVRKRDQTVHFGSCLLSRALLCAGSRQTEMLDFIYDHQEDFHMTGERYRTENDGKYLDQIRSQVVAKFPEIKDCIDAPDTKMKLNKHLKLAEGIPLVTPQLYINGSRLCEDDSDLGLDYALTRLVGKK